MYNKSDCFQPRDRLFTEIIRTIRKQSFIDLDVLIIAELQEDFGFLYFTWDFQL